MADETRSAFRLTPQVIVGLLIIVWGLVLTAGNLGWMEPTSVRELLRYWPLAIVAVGVAKIASSDCRSGQAFGAVIALIGLWLTAGQVYAFRVHIWQWWPLLLVGGGIFLIIRAWERRNGAPGTSGDGAPWAYQSAHGQADFAFWSGVERRVAVPDFKRADLTAIMGGIELDLRGAGTATGEAVVDVFALMGGIEITVPPDWIVVNRIAVIMGGVEDKSTGTQDAKHRLILRGFVLMGGVEIKT